MSLQTLPEDLLAQAAPTLVQLKLDLHHVRRIPTINQWLSYRCLSAST